MAATTYNYKNNRSMMRRTAPPVGKKTASPRSGNDGRYQSAPQASRLQQMQAQFQKNVLLEKERKLIALHQRTMHQPERTQQGFRKDKMAEGTPLRSGGKKGIVREFFKERRQMGKDETAERLLPPTTHLQMLRSEQQALQRQEQIKQEELQSFAQTHRREQSQKLRAGYNKHKPLAPIKQPFSNDRFKHLPTYQADANDQVSPNHFDIEPPKREPHLMKQQSDSGGMVPRTQFEDRQKAHKVSKIRITSTPPRRLPKVANASKLSPLHTKEVDTCSANLSDFQKWQMEQDQKREKRLQNYADNLTVERERRSFSGTFNDKEKSRLIHLKEQKHENGSKKIEQGFLKRERESMRRKEKELEAMIAKHQEELAQLQMEDSDYDDENEEELSNTSVHCASEEQITKEHHTGWQRNNTRNQANGSRQVGSYAQYGRNYYYDRNGNEITDLAKTSGRCIQRPTKSRKESNVMEKNVHGNNKTWGLDDGREQQPTQKYERKDTTFYAQAVSDLPENTSNIDLRPCHICGRKFAAERLSKHVTICQKAFNTKRKVFDSTKHRAEGTDFAEYVRKGRHLKKPVKEPTNNWRKKHEQFVHAVRDARKVQAHIARGGKLSDLPPPPPAENPDYQQCPYCKRKFNPNAAERHVPHCKTAKSRPKPPPRR